MTEYFTSSEYSTSLSGNDLLIAMLILLVFFLLIDKYREK